MPLCVLGIAVGARGITTRRVAHPADSVAKIACAWIEPGALSSAASFAVPLCADTGIGELLQQIE